jgi:hypothetical protein
MNKSMTEDPSMCQNAAVASAYRDHAPVFADAPHRAIVPARRIQGLFPHDMFVRNAAKSALSATLAHCG